MFFCEDREIRGTGQGYGHKNPPSHVGGRGTFLLDQLNLFQPLRDAFGIPVHGSEAFQVTGIGREFGNLCQRLVAVGRGVGAEGDDRLAFEIVTFGKGVDNHRDGPPPHGAADEHRVVAVPVRYTVLDGGSGVLLLLRLGYLGAGRVFRGVRLDGFDAEQGAAGLPGNVFGYVLRVAAPAEVSHEDFSVLGKGARCAHHDEREECEDSCFHCSHKSICH